MKKILFILLFLPFVIKAQTLPLSVSGGSGSISSTTFPLGTFSYNILDTQRIKVNVLAYGSVWGIQNYSAFTLSGVPFPSMDSLTRWVNRNFFATNFTKSQLDSMYYTTGWAAYQDTVYTSLSPFHLLSGAKRTLPNRAQMTIESQKPIDVSMFYNKTDSTITGRTGDGLNVYVEFVAIPDASTTYLQATIDIGGVVGELYNGVYTFPNGAGVPQRISFSFAGYTLDTWQANGAKVKVMSDGNCDIYSQRYVLTRTHKAR